MGRPVSDRATSAFPRSGRRHRLAGGMALPLAAATALGIVLAGLLLERHGVPSPQTLLILAGVTFGICATALFPSREVIGHRSGGWALLAAAVLAGALLYGVEQRLWEGWPPLSRHEAEAVLVGEVLRSQSSGFLLQVSGRGPAHAADAQSGRVWVTGAGQAVPGHLVVVQGMLHRPHGPAIPGLFNERSWVRSRGAAWRMRAAATAQQVGAAPGISSSWRRRAHELRQHFRSTWFRVLSPAAAGMLQGMVMGDRSGLPRERQRQLAESGLIHLTAVSGFHIGLVAAMPLWWLAARRRAPALQAVLAAPLLTIYLSLAGLDPPAFRALIMAAVGLISASLGRRGHPLQGLALAALVLLLSGPSRLYSLSFQLSFAATAGIILLTGPLNRLLFGRLPRLLGDGLAVTTAAQLGILPLALHTFHQFSLVAPLSNLLAVPAVVITLALALLLTALAVPLYLVTGGGLVGPGLTGAPWLEAAWQVVQPPAAALLWVAETMSAWTGAAYYGAWGAWAVAAYYILFGAGSLGPRRLPLLLTGAALVLTLVQGWQTEQGPRVTVLPVGGGTAVVAVWESGETLVYGAGGTPWQLRDDPLGVDGAAGYSLLPVLRTAGHRQVDALVLRSGQLRDTGAALELMRAMPVGTLYLPPGAQADAAGQAGAPLRLQALKDEAARQQVKVRRLEPGQLWRMGGGSMTVLNPLNGGAPPLRLSMGELELTVTGEVSVDAKESGGETGRRRAARALVITLPLQEPVLPRQYRGSEAGWEQVRPPPGT